MIKSKSCMEIFLVINLIFFGLQITTHFVLATPGADFTPPFETTITMYALDERGNNIGILCQPGDRFYGCTYYDEVNYPNNSKPYPFDTSTPTLQIEDDRRLINGEEVQLGYLPNVVPLEVAINVASQGNKPTACVEMMAIAARTYLYYNLNEGYSLNNSDTHKLTQIKIESRLFKEVLYETE